MADMSDWEAQTNDYISVTLDNEDKPMKKMADRQLRDLIGHANYQSSVHATVIGEVVIAIRQPLTGSNIGSIARFS